MDKHSAYINLVKTHGHHCALCKIKSNVYYSFGKLEDGTEVYQDVSKNIFISETSEVYSRNDFETKINYEDQYRMQFVKVKMIFENGNKHDFSPENIKFCCKRCIERIKKKYMAQVREERKEKRKLLYPEPYLPYWLYIKRKKEKENEQNSGSTDRD
jgi:hypothetical protein